MTQVLQTFEYGAICISVTSENFHFVILFMYIPEMWNTWCKKSSLGQNWQDTGNLNVLR